MFSKRRSLPPLAGDQLTEYAAFNRTRLPVRQLCYPRVPFQSTRDNSIESGYRSKPAGHLAMLDYVLEAIGQNDPNPYPFALKA